MIPGAGSQAVGRLLFSYTKMVATRRLLSQRRYLMHALVQIMGAYSGKWSGTPFSSTALTVASALRAADMASTPLRKRRDR